MYISYTLKWRGTTEDQSAEPTEEDLYRLAIHIAPMPGDSGMYRDLKLSVAKTIVVFVHNDHAERLEREISPRWGVISKSGPWPHAVPAQGVWVCSLMSTHESVVRAPYPVMDGHVTVELPGLLAYYNIPSHTVNDHWPVLAVGPNLVEFRVWSWCEAWVREAIQLKLITVYASALTQERAMIIFTVPRTELERSSREERPALEQIEERMGLPRGVLDRNFGVVEVSDESWCVRGPGWCASQIQDHRVFSDSVIRPVGLPEPESK